MSDLWTSEDSLDDEEAQKDAVRSGQIHSMFDCEIGAVQKRSCVVFRLHVICSFLHG